MKIEVTDNEVLNNILNLMKIKGVRQTDLARYPGISKNAITQWKTHVSKSYMNYLDKLAEYFDVTPEEILRTNKDDIYESHLTLDEQEIIRYYRVLPDNTKSIVSQLLSTLSSSQN